MTKIINLDCDGTFINLYGVNGWLDDLINEDVRVKQTKLEWFETHIPSVKFDNVYIVDYGTPKTSLAKGILFDDEEHNRNEWNGIAFDEKDLIKKMRAFL